MIHYLFGIKSGPLSSAHWTVLDAVVTSTSPVLTGNINGVRLYALDVYLPPKFSSNPLTVILNSYVELPLVGAMSI